MIAKERTEQNIINEAVAEAKQRQKIDRRIQALMRAKNLIIEEISQLELERDRNSSLIPTWQVALQEKIDKAMGESR